MAEKILELRLRYSELSLEFFFARVFLILSTFRTFLYDHPGLCESLRARSCSVSMTRIFTKFRNRFVLDGTHKKKVEFILCSRQLKKISGC